MEVKRREDTMNNLTTESFRIKQSGCYSNSSSASSAATGGGSSKRRRDRISRALDAAVNTSNCSSDDILPTEPSYIVNNRKQQGGGGGLFEIPASTPKTTSLSGRVMSPSRVILSPSSSMFPKSTNNRAVSIYAETPPLPPVIVRPSSVTVADDQQPATTTISIDHSNSSWFNHQTPIHNRSSNPPSAEKEIRHRQIPPPPLPKSMAAAPQHQYYPSSTIPIVNIHGGGLSSRTAPPPPDFKHHIPPSPPSPPIYNANNPFFANQEEERATGMYRQYYNSLTAEQQLNLRQKFNEKFLILQRRYPEWNIAIPSEDSSLEYMHSLYESYVKQMTIHDNSKQYKFFLVIVFIAIEFGSLKAGVNLSGYAECQIRAMKRYEATLLELGTKYYSSGGGEWPVEMRILMIAVVQAAVFFVAKYAEKFTNSPGMAKVVHSTIDGLIDKIPSTGNGDLPNVDAQGLPMAPGTEADVSAVDSNESSQPSAGSRVAQAPAFDLGGLLGSIMGGAGGGNGAGGGMMDMAKLVGTAMSFVTQGSPVTTTSPKAPNRSTTSPKAPKGTAPPRRVPIFSE